MHRLSSDGQHGGGIISLALSLSRFPDTHTLLTTNIITITKRQKNIHRLDSGQEEEKKIQKRKKNDPVGYGDLSIFQLYIREIV